MPSMLYTIQYNTHCNSIQYNSIQYSTVQLIFDIALLFRMPDKLRSALSRLGGADAIVMQSTVGEELAQGP